MAHAVILNPELWGIGLGEDTALIIEKDHKATCCGSGMVWLVNAKNLGQTNVKSADKGCPIYAENLQVHILTGSCTIDLNNNTFQGSEHSETGCN
ncbi:MAG TPA: hypothetical protein VIG85_01480 [Comamonas sp.]